MLPRLLILTTICSLSAAASTLQTGGWLSADHALDENGACSVTGAGNAACDIDTWEPGEFGTRHATGSISASASANLLMVNANTDIWDGEHAAGGATVDAEQTLNGAATGAGFARFLVSWDLNVLNAWGSATATFPGGQAVFDYSEIRNIGQAWTDPIPMMWGEPFGYSLSLAGNFLNSLGDCCGGMSLSLQITDWAGFDADGNPVPLTVIPEPRPLVVLPIGLLAIWALQRRKRAAHAPRAA